MKRTENRRAAARSGGDGRPGQTPDSKAPALLLKALSESGAYGLTGEDSGCERLLVAAPRNGISIVVARFELNLEAPLCSAGLAIWRTGAVSGRRRLEITSAGRARLLRQSPPAGADPFLAQHKPLARSAAEPAERRPSARARPGAASRQAARPAPTAGGGVIIDQAESPLAWLANRKGTDGKPLIGVASLEAGERLRRDFTFAGLEPRMTADWSANGAGGSGSGALTYSDSVIAARQRVGAALDFVGADFAGLLLDVCGFLKGLEIIEGERRWPRRSAKLVLILALRQLARHYGIGESASGPARSTGVLHWGAEGFRPAIQTD